MMGDFNILGSEIEPNGSGDGIVDLNDGAGGEYIYLYVSRNHQIRPLLEGIYIDSLDYVTSGNHRTDPNNLNHGAGGTPLYIHCPFFTDRATCERYFIRSTDRIHVENETLSVTPSQEVTMTPAGGYLEWYGEYTGTFDGNGHVIRNLTVQGSNILMLSAGLFGTMSGTVKNLGMEKFSYEYGEKDTRVGAIAGQVIKKGQVTNCYVNDADIQTTDRVAGGIAGAVYEGSVTNCYVVNAKITGARIGDIAGEIRGDASAEDREGSITNCCIDGDDLSSGYVRNNMRNVATEQFASGEVCWYLNNGTGSVDPVWGQRLGTDSYPVFRTLNNTVCSCIDKVYYNHEYVNGICKYCSEDEMPPTDENGVYQISDKDDMLGFAEAVNDGFTDLDAVLTTDIDMTGARWTIMASYEGTFDGNGHTINALSKDAGLDDGKRHGFIRRLETASTVKNLTFTNADIFNHEGSGATSAVIAYNNRGTIENCMVMNSNIQHGKYDALGLIAGVNSGTIRNTASVSNTMTRRFSAAKAVCGFVWSNSGTIEHCYTYECTYQNGTERYAFTGINSGTITNCYYSESSESLSDTLASQMTADQFASGEAAYLLQNGRTETAWGQTIGTDNYPVAGGSKVYRCKSECGNTFYSNTENDVQPHAYDKNGFCTSCEKGYMPSVLNENDKYEISNAGQLYWFMEYVNSTKLDEYGEDFANLDAVLVADITVNENVLNEDGTLADGTFRKWFPIGFYEESEHVNYAGTFDGQGHTISGLCFDDEEQRYVGLFGQIGSGAKIQNVNVTDSYFKAGEFVGGIVGNSQGEIINCAYSGTAAAKSYAGGVCGYNSGTIANCMNIGTVTGNTHAGGVCGCNSGKIANSYHDGDGDDAAESTTGISTERFKSGEIAYLLSEGCTIDETKYSGGIWGQTIGEQTYPVLGGTKVYRGYENCTDVIYANVALETEPQHSYQCDVDGNTLSISCANEDCKETGEVEISAENKSYDGNPASVSVTTEGVLAEQEFKIFYMDVNGNRLENVPVNAGTYIAATAYGKYEIRTEFTIKTATETSTTEQTTTTEYVAPESMTEQTTTTEATIESTTKTTTTEETMTTETDDSASEATTSATETDSSASETTESATTTLPQTGYFVTYGDTVLTAMVMILFGICAIVMSRKKDEE